MESGIQLTLEMCMPELCPWLTVGASAHPAKTSQWQDTEKDLKETEVPSFEKYFESLGKRGKKIDPNGSSTKMLRECFQATEDLTSLPFSLKWIGGGTTQNGFYSTLNITEYPRTGRECILSDILEVEVPQKYFLSKEQTERIVFTESDKSGGVLKESRNNPSVYRVYDTDGLSPTLTDMAGGGREPHTIEVIGHDARRTIHDTDRVLGEGGVLPLPSCEGLQRTTESGVIVVGNTNPSGKGMNGNCYFSEGVNPAVTCNKHEGNRVAIPVLTPDRAYKRQNGRRFKEDGEESFTLTAQDRHGVAVSVVPMELSGYELSEAGSEAHSLNCSDQRKVFGAHQKRTMVGYNATLKRGGGTTNIARALSARDYKGLSGSEQMMTTAAYLLSTKDTDQKNEKSQTVSKQGRTEGCQKEGRKER